MPEEGGKRKPVVSKGLQATVRERPLVINLNAASLHELRLNGRVDGVECDFLIDTGATHSVMHSKMLEPRTRHKIQPCHALIRSVSGETIPVLGRVQVNIQIGNLSLQHHLFVADIDFDCILGMDFLKNQDCAIDFSRRTFRVKNQKVSIAVALCEGVPRGTPASTTPLPPLQALNERSSHRLQPAQQKILNDLLTKNSAVFSLGPTDQGRTSLRRHRIDTADVPPIKQAARRIPFARRNEALQLVEEMAQQGVIRPSKSPWCSPVVLVKKKDGSTRFCVDYRQVNEATKKDSYPLPRIDLILEALAGSKWFATLDLQSGYWQVEMDESSREKTAFTCGNGLWEFTVMPFGLCNAPATFQRLMEEVLAGIPYTTCLVYLDDIIVHAATFEELIERLQLIFDRLRDAGLKLSPTKCELCQESVQYLGHIVSAEGSSPDPGKIDTVQQWPQPRNRKEVQSFLGLCAYYRRFVKNFSHVAKPLHHLTEKSQRFLWDERCEAAFTQLKTLLTNAPILSQPRLELPFILDTDASHHAMGAVLSQKIDGEERVIEYYSKTFNRAELNYCVTRKELLAVVRAVKHFQPYLLGRHFVLRTDHASLRWLMNFREPEGQVARWIQCLQEYDFDIVHRPGRQHGNADALSRRPCLDRECRYCQRLEQREEVNVRVTQVQTDFAAIQKEDPTLGLVHQWLQEGKPTKEEIRALSPEAKAYWSMWSTIFLCDEKACRHISHNRDDDHQLLVPRSRVKDLLVLAHDSPIGGHYGFRKTLQKVKKQFYWPNCSRDVEDYCRTCSTCQARSGPRTRQRSSLQICNSGAPFERVAVDILGPLPETERGKRYILVVMDYFTKWPEAIAIPDQTAETVAEACIEHVFSRFGAPMQLHSDQGRNFEASVFQETMRLFGIDKTRTTALHPQSDGMVERFNRTILDYLAKFVNDNQRDWDTLLPFLLMSYRSAVHETTKNTPARLVFGRELRLPIALCYGFPPQTQTPPDVYIDMLMQRLQKIHDYNRMELEATSRRMKDRYDLKSNTNVLEVGTLVWLYAPKRTVGRCPKLQMSWEGPYEVLETLSPVTYRIRHQQKARAKTIVVHRDRLARYLTRQSP